MRKITIITIIAAMAITAIAADAYKFPGWDKEASLYEAEIARYEAASETQKPFTVTHYNQIKLARALAGVEIASFDDIHSAAQKSFPGNAKYACNYACARAFAIYNANKNSQKAIAILREAYEFSLRAKSHHCGVIAQNTTMRKKLGISNDEAVTVLINALSVIESARYRDIKTMLNALYELLPDCSVAEAEQLAALKKLNRRFSKELLGGNKEQWEPIIARLRTVIAAY